MGEKKRLSADLNIRHYLGPLRHPTIGCLTMIFEKINSFMNHPVYLMIQQQDLENNPQKPIRRIPHAGPKENKP